MPNHVTTVLIASKQVLDYLRPEMVPGDEEFGADAECDFNRVIPMPHHTDPIFTAERSEMKDADGNVTGALYSMTGYSPLDWARDHWGTKWNAYEVTRENDSQLRFDTAWSHPLPVIEELSRIFPNEGIVVMYADEDLGFNLGSYSMLNGQIRAVEPIEPGSDEARDFAAGLKYDMTYAELMADFETESD